MSAVNEALGKYVSHSRIDCGICIFSENALVEATVYSDAVCRISAARSLDEPEAFSYAVVQEPEAVDFLLEEDEERIIVETSLYSLRIQKFPLRFSFFTPGGVLVNEDDPAFGISWIGDEITAYKSLQPGERFLGLGEKTGNLDRRGSSFTNWNTDHFAYPADADPLYTSFPFYIGVHGGLCYGIFLDSTYRSTFNFGASNNRFSFFSAEAGQMAYYFIRAEDVAGIIREFTRLTGRIPLPPLWSLGYQQCRFSYYPDSELRAVARGFRERGIPADLIYLDIHYMHGFRMFTWDRKRFPEPEKLVRELRDMGFHAAVILDPGIKIEEGYEPWEDGRKKDVFLKYPDGAVYCGKVWPGCCAFPDFTNPGVRRWWSDRIKSLVDTGIDGFWNDMNEPSCWGQNIPNLVEFDFEGSRAAHRKARNVYGMQMARSTSEGALKWMSGRRPFVLTRSGFAGVQRYSALWTGDNVSDDEHMFADIRMICSMGLSGAAFCGFDIGGFAGECTPDLFARWISTGMFAPFARVHSMIDSRDAEPWSFGETVEGIAANFIRLRYRLLPYIYSLFYECTCTGMPVARSLAVYYPEDDRVYEHSYQHQFFFGGALMVAPAASWDRIIKVYLPEGRWYDFYTDQVFEGGSEVLVEAPLEKLPLFVRAGSVLPMQEPVQCTAGAFQGLLQLHVYAGGESSGGIVFYEDDGVSFEHEKGAFFKREIRVSGDELVLEPAEGELASGFARIKFFFHGLSSEEDDLGADLNGEALALKKERLRLFEPVSPFYNPEEKPLDPYGELGVFTAEACHSRNRIRLSPACP